MSSFFTSGPAEDDLYKSLRDGLTFSEDEKIIQSMFFKDKDDKRNIEDMWSLYKPYADNNFLQEVRKYFHPRFWEMYLGFSLIKQGISLVPYDKHKGGPDLLILSDKLKVWLEAVAPTAGTSADAVPEIECGVVRDVPDEQIKLRYSSVIDEKYEKFKKYTKKKIILEDDCYVIAVNGGAIPSASKEIDIPRIVRCVIPVGNEVIEINISSLEVLDVHHQYQDASYKKSGSPVSTNIFLNSDNYDGISAILFSNVHALNYPNYPGNDFVLIHNPRAKNPLPRGLIQLGREYWVENSTLKLSNWMNH